MSASIWWGFVGAGQPHFAFSVHNIVFSQSGNSLCPLQMQDATSSPFSAFLNPGISRRLKNKLKHQDISVLGYLLNKSREGPLNIAADNGGPLNQAIK